jgi:secreted PhoX family phosphatase
MRSAWRSACLIALTVASCGGPKSPALADAGGGDGAMEPTSGLELVAGDIGGHGNEDGAGTAARFDSPSGVAVDSAGNVYVADHFNHTIRKVTAGGVVTTLAGTAGTFGSVDGTGAAARFYYPDGVAVDSAGNVYVADDFNATIRKVTAGGVVTTLAGAAGVSGSADGTGAAASFDFPQGVAVDGAGNLYVTDSGNNIIRKVTTGGVVTTLAGRFHSPTGVAVDSAGNVYVADTGNSTIRKITPIGSTPTVAGMAGVVGVVLGAAPRFAAPRYLAVSGDSLVISDANAILLLHHVIQ